MCSCVVQNGEDVLTSASGPDFDGLWVDFCGKTRREMQPQNKMVQTSFSRLNWFYCLPWHSWWLHLSGENDSSASLRRTSERRAELPSLSSQRLQKQNQRLLSKSTQVCVSDLKRQFCFRGFLPDARASYLTVGGGRRRGAVGHVSGRDTETDRK